MRSPARQRARGFRSLSIQPPRTAVGLWVERSPGPIGRLLRSVICSGFTTGFCCVLSIAAAGLGALFAVGQLLELELVPTGRQTIIRIGLQSNLKLLLAASITRSTTMTFAERFASATSGLTAAHALPMRRSTPRYDDFHAKRSIVASFMTGFSSTRSPSNR